MFLLFLFRFYHAIDTQDDEGYREDLAHVEWERGFEGFLHFLGVFDEEAEGKDISQTEAKIPTCTNLLRHALMQIPHQTKEDGVGNGLVELSWMARHHINPFEDKGPWHIRNLANNLRVHEVSKTDKASCYTSGNGDIVKYRPDAQFRMLHIEPKGKHQSQCATMRGKACITYHEEAKRLA